MTSYAGALLAESLRPDAVLDGIPLTVTKIYRAALGDAGAGQPELWTVFEFQVPGDRVRELAEALSRLLVADGGWYCDFRSAVRRRRCSWCSAAASSATRAVTAPAGHGRGNTAAP